MYAAYTKFEKQHGTKNTLETTVLGKRRIQYEDELSHDGRNYDVWFDYARLEEGALKDLQEEGVTAEEEQAAINRVREVYERAVAQVPPGGEKRHWRRYIFLWLYYALFEELETKVGSNHSVREETTDFFIGLRQSTTDIPDCAQAGATQAVYFCEALATICTVRAKTIGPACR